MEAGGMDEVLDSREALLLEAEECLADGDPEGSLLAATELLRFDPSIPEAHYLRSLALRELERVDEALVAVEAALEADPSFAEAAYTHADLLTFDLGEPELALDLCDHFLREDLEDTLYADFLTLKGNALCELSDFEGALACFDRTAELSPDRDDVGSRGWALFELGRMEEAVAALRAATQGALSQNPANHLYLAVALTRLGDERGAAKHFRIAARFDPDLYHVPRPFSEEQVLQTLDETSRSLPAVLQRGMEGLLRRVERWPELDLLGPAHVSPLALLRIHVPDGERMSGQGAILGSVLIIYADNLAFICSDLETMAEELQVALWLELVEFLDLDEEEIESYGVH